MDDNALLAELERNLESEYGSDTQSVDSLSEIRALRSSSTNSPATQSAESSLSNRSKRNSIEDLFSSEKVLILGALCLPLIRSVKFVSIKFDDEFNVLTRLLRIKCDCETGFKPLF